MELILPTGETVRGDLVPTIIKRTDLTAVPSTLEFLIRVDEDMAEYIQQGKLISLADPDVKYYILAISTQGDTVRAQGNPNYQLTKVIAVLESCHQISFAAERAIIKENTSFADIYRACGAKINTTKNINVDKFSCYVGNPPSFSIQIALQRAAATIVWNGKNDFAFTRLRDLFEQEPVETLETDTTKDFVSGFVERHEIPRFYSNKANGTLANGNAKKGRAAEYEMFADEQVLNNLSTYLLQRKVWTTRFMPNVNAGEIVDVAGKKYVIITATHLFSQSESGSGSQLSRFWLGELSTNSKKG